jgi:hypothetical protein
MSSCLFCIKDSAINGLILIKYHIFEAKIAQYIQWYIQKFPDWIDKEMYAYLWYYSLRSNTKGYGGKTHWTDSQNSDTTAPSGRDLFHLQFMRQAASPETFGYTFV